MQQLSKSMFRISSSIYISIAFLALLFIFTPATHAQYYNWSIDSFDSVIQIHEDATITVVETIEVDFDIQKHGIYRDIPIRYKDSFGNNFKPKLDVVSVLQDGKHASVEYLYDYNYINLKIGESDTLITGQHVYEITYTVDRVFLYFESYDEFYWNVTGSDWEVPIDSVHASIILPNGAIVEQFSCYTGYYGSIETDCTGIDHGNLIEFQANDFLTVAVGFTKGVIYEPTTMDRYVWIMKDNWHGLIFILIALFTFWTWLKKGRDPKMTSSVIAEYEPPKKIKSVYAGMLVHNKLKRDHLTSMLIQMAVDGYLKIESESIKKNGKKRRKPSVTLVPLKSSDGLDVAHSEFFKMIFQDKMESVALSKIKGTIPASAMKSMKNSLKDKLIQEGYYVENSFKTQSLFMISGVVILFIGIFFSSIFGLFFGACSAFSGIVILIFGYLMPALTKEGLEMRRKVLGFKDFMHTAERYRSEWQEKENIFANYLPYAIAFNDVKRWSKTFKDIHQSTPKWYSGDVVFMTVIANGQFSTISDSMRSATTMPSSSGGSSGGGFSGGGFGGGGGGSW